LKKADEIRVKERRLFTALKMRRTFVCLGSLIALPGGCGGTEEATPEATKLTAVETDPLEGLRDAPNVSTLDLEAALTEPAARAAVVVPDLVGLRLDVAADEVGERGLSYELGGGTYGVVNEAAWTVCSQKSARHEVEERRARCRPNPRG
jgi:hypothetical protein